VPSAGVAGASHWHAAWCARPRGPPAAGCNRSVAAGGDGSSAASTFSYRHARHLAALSVTTSNAIVARASTPVAQTSDLVARLSRSVAIRCVRRRCSTIHISMRFCASLSAYRGAAVLFKLLDVLVAAAQPVPGLVGGFCCAASFNAHGAERDGGTAIEWCAHCLASR
jgi:hypothetical protein